MNALEPLDVRERLERRHASFTLVIVVVFVLVVVVLEPLGVHERLERLVSLILIVVVVFVVDIVIGVDFLVDTCYDREAL